MSTEFVVVQTQIVGNPRDGYEFVSWEVARRPSLYSAKRVGLAELGHDDFNIAVLDDGRLTRWTWMGEDTEPPTTHDELVELAESLGWEVAQ